MYFLAFSLILTLLILIFLLKNYEILHLVDIPNYRSSHNIIKPKGAGIAIYLSLILTFIIFKYDFFIQNFLFFISISIVFTIGLIDDIFGVRPKAKFIFIFLAITLVFFFDNFKISSLGVWFEEDLKLPTIFSFLFTLFAVSGFTNALNLIDGLDGLAAGVSIIILSAFFYLGKVYNDTFIINVSAIIIISLVVFLLFNWYPSKIFLGDSGSLLLGFIISLLSIKLITYINTISILLLTALPILDTIIVMTRRVQRGFSPFYPDKDHLHHKLVRWKNRVDFSVTLLLFIQLILSLIGVITIHLKNSINFIIYLLLLKVAFYIFDDRRTPREKSISIHSKISNLILNIPSKYLYSILFTILFLLIIFKN